MHHSMYGTARSHASVSVVQPCKLQGFQLSTQESVIKQGSILRSYQYTEGSGQRSSVSVVVWEVCGPVVPRRPVENRGRAEVHEGNHCGVRLLGAGHALKDFQG